MPRWTRERVTAVTDGYSAPPQLATVRCAGTARRVVSSALAIRVASTAAGLHDAVRHRGALKAFTIAILIGRMVQRGYGRRALTVVCDIHPSSVRMALAAVDVAIAATDRVVDMNTDFRFQ